MTDSLIGRYFELLNAERWEELVSLFHPDGEAYLPGRPYAAGREAIRALYSTAVPATFPRHIARVVHTLSATQAGFAYVQVDVTGPDGVDKVVHAVDVFEFRDDLISSIRVIYDRLAASS